jgi:hypothetical protein
MKDVIELARESCLDVYGLGKDHLAFVDALQRFAVLVRKDEREQGQKWFDAVTAQYKQLILAEREACAKVCEATGQHNIINQCAAAIRNRGNT